MLDLGFKRSFQKSVPAIRLGDSSQNRCKSKEKSTSKVELGNNPSERVKKRERETVYR